ncbi:hypothetical protein [Nostoc sp. PA-18-2419]|uniref:hypothetical protein n=1 Tax=Nostoc sp. PA-18-2419 TaxID=2575443 RepID=UPI0011083647|nr:hypothetical protein [Nostoc sp. PA-18-2419]
MADLITLAAAQAIAKVAFNKFFESGVGKLGEKFTEAGLKKIDELYQKIRKKLSGNAGASNALADVERGNQDALQRVAVYLLDEMQADANFATDVQKIADEINIHRVEDNSSQNQYNYGGQNYQTKTGADNTNQFGNVTNNNYYGNPPQP